MLTSVFLQRRKCGGCLRGEISLIFFFISKCLSFLANLLEETLTSLQIYQKPLSWLKNINTGLPLKITPVVLCHNSLQVLHGQKSKHII